MPVITYQGAHLGSKQKKDLIEKLTATAVEVTQISSNFFTVVLQEFSEENLGVNGESVSDIKARIQG